MADDLAPWLRDWQLFPCEHSSRTYPLACSPCLRDRLLGSDWLAAHNAEVAEKARADALREFANMLDGAESYDVLSATKPDGVRWGEASVYDSIANSGPISDWLRIYAARTPDPNGDNT